jgi:hypothetical protein
MAEGGGGGGEKIRRLGARGPLGGSARRTAASRKQKGAKSPRWRIKGKAPSGRRR